jgi:hypothetical protein
MSGCQTTRSGWRKQALAFYENFLIFLQLNFNGAMLCLRMAVPLHDHQALSLEIGSFSYISNEKSRGMI